MAALPWIAADVGFHFGAGVFRSGQPFEGKPSVHLGHHHGLDGTLLAVTAVLLWRAGDRMRRRHLRAVTRVYLALMLSYGLVNAANDFWDEQVVKRGWATRMIPNALVPSVSVIWLIVLTGAAVLYALGFARRDIVPLTGIIRRDERSTDGLPQVRQVRPGRQDHALEPITGDERGVADARGCGSRVPDPLVASRTERTILHDMGHDAGDSALLDGALDLAERLASAAEEGRVDLADLGRRARKLLAATARPDEAEPLF